MTNLTTFESKVKEKPCRSIIEWYKGLTILVTGGSGFMGKVLLEKLLRICPDIKKIYIIIRAKRGLAPKTRIQEMAKLPVFKKLLEENPEVFKKLIPIEGDVTTENLGLTAENLKLLTSEVNVVFHCAATLKLEAVLKDSVQHNLYGTEYLFKFCSQIKQLKVVVHLSTAFCHCDVEVLEEQIYPPTKDPKQIMNVVDCLDDESLEFITPSLIKPHPNTYTFTKRLAETIAYEYGKQMPVIILRPSIVIPTIKDPIPGWVDSLNGPVGVLVGAGKGVIRSMLVEADNHAEIIPVDIAINAIVLSAWYRDNYPTKETPVFNISQSDVHPITWGEVLERGRRIVLENPFDWPLWYPDGNIHTNTFVHNMIVFLFQIIPAYFMDVMFLIFTQKRFLVRIQNRIKLGMLLLQYFTLREWKFNNKKFLRITELIPKEEKEMLVFTELKYDIDEYFKDIIVGARRYCLKEKDENIPWAKTYIKILYVLDRFCKAAFIFGLIYFCFKLASADGYFFNSYQGEIKKF